MDILIVEDDIPSAMILADALETSGHSVVEARSGVEAWKMYQAASGRLPQVVISDWMMPDMDGIELCRNIRRSNSGVEGAAPEYTYIIMLTSKGERQDRLEALEAGVDDFLVKPLDPDELTARLNVARRILDMQADLRDRSARLETLHTALERQNSELAHSVEMVEAANAHLETRVRERTQELAESNRELMLAYDATIVGWSRALDLRDRETEGHTQRVAEMGVRLARAVGIPEPEIVHIRRGALLHDIGKMGIPDSILLKPAGLTDDEWDVMRKHPDYAFRMLTPITFLQPALCIPYCHHEKWDGTGYPRGLKGQSIPLAARLFAIVDVFDALTSDRPYREAWTVQTVLKHLRDQAGTHFDPQLVEEFIKLVEEAEHLGEPSLFPTAFAESLALVSDHTSLPDTPAALQPGSP
jgi:putative two-component system response regulator